VLRNINMVPVEELSEEAIATARARRSRERWVRRTSTRHSTNLHQPTNQLCAPHRSAYLKMDLDEVELPENHPWAVKKPVGGGWARGCACFRFRMAAGGFFGMLEAIGRAPLLTFPAPNARAQVSEEQEAQIAARLQVRRGVPRRGLEGAEQASAASGRRE
jgi:hypothetical protein